MIFYEEPGATVYCGHILKELAALPDSSVDCVMTSPPYWGLRKYKTEPQIWDDPGSCEHEWGEELIRRDRGKAEDSPFLRQPRRMIGTKTKQGNFCLKCAAWRGELGSEPMIKLYISHLMQIFDEVARVLKRTGTCWVNLDDSYASGKGTCFNPGGGSSSFPGFDKRKDAGAYPLDRGNISMLKAEGLTPKSLCLIPSRFALAMLEHGWIVRNDVAWNKKNPKPESVKDRFTTAWEHLFFFTRARRYFFEQQFEPYTEPLNRWGGPTITNETTKMIQYRDEIGGTGATSLNRLNRPIRPNALGRNKRDAWEIKTEGYPDAHFATFPEKLCETPILAGCPSAICRKCGKPRQQIYKKGFTDHSGETQSRYPAETTANRLALLRQAAREQGGEYVNETQVIGITDCGCGAGFEPGTLLDPFCGSGRALAVAKKLGRKAIGIDLSPDYCKMTVKQLQAIPLPMEL